MEDDMHKGLIGLFTAAVLTISHSAAALDPQGDGARNPRQNETAWNQLPLAPIPYLDTMPWIDARLWLRAPQVNALLQTEPATPFGARYAGSAPQVFSQMTELNPGMTR